MHDVTKLSDVKVGMNVKIYDRNYDSYYEGEIMRVKSTGDDPDGIFVILNNGHQGNTILINNSKEIG